MVLANSFLDLIAKILTRKFLVHLGKLTFVAYLVHVDVIYVLYANVKEPFQLSMTKIVS